MGHAFRHCGYEINGNWKRFGKKKLQFSGLLFFLSILEAGASAIFLAQTTVQCRSKIDDVDISMYTLFTKSYSRALLCRQFD